MFNRDLGAEDLASDPTFAWPPSGFRDRRPFFGRTADPSTSASSPHHQRKSSDQVIQSLRDELDKHRQMFFDRLAPQWESTAQRTGFPFTDTARRAFSGIDRTMPQQHPSYAFHQDDIPAWMPEDDAEPALGRAGNRQRWPSSGSGRSAESNSSGSSESGQHKFGRSDSPGRPRMPKPAARSATGDFPPGSPAMSPKGFSRASSAPPVAPNAENGSSCGSPRRIFTSTLHHQPVNSPSNQPAAATNSPGPSRRHAHIHHNSSGSTGSTVHHIPIMVEGRDEPLLPSVAEEGQSAAAEKRSKTAIPMPFYPAANEKTTTNSPSNSQKEEVKRDASIPIPLPYDRLSDDSGKSVGSSASNDLQTVNDLEQIERIQRETEALLPRVESFRGDRNDRGFLFLDEMLTRLLLKLDNVQVEGREEVRQARRQAIASITRCINLLESKLLNSIEKMNEKAEESNRTNDEVGQSNEQPEVPSSDENIAPQSATHITQLVINIPSAEQPTQDPKL